MSKKKEGKMESSPKAGKKEESKVDPKGGKDAKGVKSEGDNVLMKSGILDAYEHFLKDLCKHGLPSGNIYEYAAIQIQKYERKMKGEDAKSKIDARIKENASKPKKEAPQPRSEEENALILELVRDEKRIKKLTKDTFETVDNEKRGYLMKDELDTAFKTFCQQASISPPTAKEAKSLTSGLDKGKDVQISYEDTLALMKSMLNNMANEAKSPPKLEKKMDEIKASPSPDKKDTGRGGGKASVSPPQKLIKK